MMHFTNKPSANASSPSKNNKEGSSTPAETMKLLPGKLAKKVKRQIRRLSSPFHHVTLPKHSASPRDALVVSSLALISSPSTVFPSIDVVRDFHPPPITLPASTRSGYSEDTFTRSDKYVKELDLERASSRSSVLSSDHHLSSDHNDSSASSIASTVDMSVEPRFAAEESSDHTMPQVPPVAEARAEEHASQTSSDSEEQEETDELSSNPATPEPMFTSPPTVYIEPEVPDPFLIDDEGDALSEDDQQDSSAAVSESHLSAAHDIPLTVTPPPPSAASVAIPSPLLSANLNKDVPPPPASSSSDEEEEEPDLYLPGLIVPTMFLPIPNTDPLTTLLTKYIYPPEKRPVRDLTGEWQRSDFHTLVMTNSWRALARMARDRIITSDPSDLTQILGLWHLRLSCLAHLRLFNQTSAECTNLFVVLNAIEPPEARAYVFDRTLPFELEVMQTRLKYWAGDHMGYLDALNALLRKCRTKARQAGSDETVLSMWKERGARISLIIASQLVEMKEFTAAARLLEPLCTQTNGTTNPPLRSAVARIYLQGGNLDMAAKHFAQVAADHASDEPLKQMNAAIMASAQGDWTTASETLKAILEKDAENYAAVNNLSVALLSQGKLKEGIDVLEAALKASPSSVVVAEPFLFNLSTLYELRSTSGVEKKRDLLVEVAQWSGDGLRATCLKLPAN
ncbi:hypothetical protein BDQ12DRAFT_681260 [Crucibulum laeve]|uniref:Uncharacterized protein n=1 Tax=Crucibulum laeve TaxID=68775 RepID=A0A5C3M3L7_9AGAR|nr:hypothetical protein BDQ12DRAFT_681260 [Crucibulum laeve]